MSEATEIMDALRGLHAGGIVHTVMLAVLLVARGVSISANVVSVGG